VEGRAAQLRSLVALIMHRFFAQNDAGSPPDQPAAEFAARLWALIEERGLPRPLADGETGTPGEITEAECAALVARVLPAGPPAPLAEAARQLVKACFYPEFKTCRDSFCATGSDGACRRQELARVRKRVSGTHCVDCPHWVAFERAEHEAFLQQHWRADRREFVAHRDVFLPEDFRALRRWLYRQARERRESPTAGN
jgi:hypothetical protein